MMKVANLKNIDMVLESGGDITIGDICPVRYAATACDDAQCLQCWFVATVSHSVRCPLGALLWRLDYAIQDALENDIFADEINPPASTT
jgi:signal transduction histidine kinase